MALSPYIQRPLNALYKTVALDNLSTYRKNPVRTALAITALALIAYVYPVLLFPMLYTAIGSFMLNMFYNLGKKAPRPVLSGGALQRKLDEARRHGYNSGHTQGLLAGEQQGYSNGYKKGLLAKQNELLLQIQQLKQQIARLEAELASANSSPVNYDVQAMGRPEQQADTQLVVDNTSSTSGVHGKSRTPTPTLLRKPSEDGMFGDTTKSGGEDVQSQSLTDSVATRGADGMDSNRSTPIKFV